MRSVTKRVLSVVLTLLLVCTLCLSAFASSGCQCGNVPYVVVSGMAVKPLNGFDSNDNLIKVYPPETKDVLKSISRVVLPTAELIHSGDWGRFANKAVPAVAQIFSPIACDDDGNSKHNITTPFFDSSMENYDFYYTLGDKDENAVIHAGVDAVGADHVFYFNYDWRLDPLQHADELNNFIESVKEQTQHDKVTLLPMSMGGTVVLSYLEKYGVEDVHNCIFISTAFQGTSVIGELFNGEFYFDKDALKNRAIQLGRTRIRKTLLSLLLNTVDRAGAFDAVMPLLDELVENGAEVFSEECIKNIFGKMPGIWALAADKDYETAKESVLDEEINRNLIDRIDYYHYNVQQKCSEILNEAIENGCFISIVAQYNMQGLPVTVSYDNNNDFLIDTQYGSAGAVCAKIDETLGDDYVQQNTQCGHNHISPDNVIDASTCLFPELTWFIKDMAHIDFNYATQAPDFITWLAGANEQYTVHSNELYPQFMRFDYDEGTLGAFSEEDMESCSTFEIVKQAAEEQNEKSIKTKEAMLKTNIQTVEDTKKGYNSAEPPETQDVAIENKTNNTMSEGFPVSFSALIVAVGCVGFPTKVFHKKKNEE
ncbi:MAG TPA: alpha/beta fold hydrolase [Clostridia bacterium]|nr:alpha/beta fold hydrolase [Clostridia bacterium]